MRAGLLLTLLLTCGFVQAQTVDPSLFGGLRYRLIGPYRGGRAVTAVGVPGQSETFYFGAVGGGVWKTENAGRTWMPIFDGQHAASIGAVAVAPSNPNVIYVGSGEADMRGDIQQGDGIYKSTDGGNTWRHIGLEDTRQIGKIVVDPKDANTVYVAALGHQYGPNEQRGVFKSTDGGQTWNKVLYKNADTGAIELAIDPNNPNVIFAALWQTRRPPWSVYPPSNGPGSGIYKSTDAGQTWQQVKGNGFPSFVGRVGLTISAADHNRIYAAVDTNDPKTGGIYRSDDGGASWKRMDDDRRLWGRGWYFCGITADPKNPNEVYVMNTSTYRSTDGGQTFTAIKGAPGGDDYHSLWIEPNDPERMILSSDQGVVVSVDGAKTWSSWYNQPTGQFYHAITDSRFPYWVYGSQQDSGAMAIPSRTIHTGISSMDWRPISVGGESGTIAPDPLRPGRIIDDGGSREDLDTAWIQSVNPILGENDEIWRSEWTQPIAGSPTDPHVFYIAHQRVFRSGDSGASWQLISPDLTRQNTGPLDNLDPSTAVDDQGLKRKGVVYWIAPSPVKAHEIWVGTDDGLIWLTNDEGANWENVTPRPLTPWSKVGVIDASHFDPETAYAAIDWHRLDDNHPYIYRTHDAGKNWALAVNGLPSDEFVNVVREDPVRRGLLYAGTDWGIYVSFDDGNNWQRFHLNMPSASIRDIVFQNGDIIVATHGRAFWILDDASPLRQLNASVSDELFVPEPAVLFQRSPSWGGPNDEGTPLPPEEPQGENPQWGAYINYVVASPNAVVTLTFKDAKGAVVSSISSTDKPRQVDLSQVDIPGYWFHPVIGLSAGPGAHRFVWNMRYKQGQGPPLPPGLYSVELAVNGHTYVQPLTIARDPRIAATDEDLRNQFDFALQVSAELEHVNALLEKAQTIRKKLGANADPSTVAKLDLLIGEDGTGTPDMGSTTPQDVNSFKHILGGLSELAGSVESAPAAPTAEYQLAFEKLKNKIAVNEAILNGINQ